ncbi:hypothetical protein D3C78_1726920 [compost metagenome]
MAALKPATSSGWTSMAAASGPRPVTSGRLETALVITGQPAAMASKTGRPKPSKYDG